MNPNRKPATLYVLMPVYNDWDCVSEILSRLDSELGHEGLSAQVLLVDDSSAETARTGLRIGSYANLSRVECLRLRRNLGHQRAISVGIGFLYSERPCDTLVVMDADGEDKPADVPRLVRRFRETGGQRVVFAQRMRRSEGFVFTLCYHTYRLLHWLLTGISVRFGNFSIVPRSGLSALAVGDTWNHYAAAVVKARIPYEVMPTERGERYAGASKFNTVGLVVHGLSAISVFAETVGVRLILVAGFCAALLFVALGAVIAIRLFTNLAIPGWATDAAGLLIILLFQMVTGAVGLTFAMLASRNRSSFLPIRDYSYFVNDVVTLYELPG